MLKGGGQDGDDMVIITRKEKTKGRTETKERAPSGDSTTAAEGGESAEGGGDHGGDDMVVVYNKRNKTGKGRDREINIAVSA